MTVQNPPGAANWPRPNPGRLCSTCAWCSWPHSQVCLSAEPNLCSSRGLARRRLSVLALPRPSRRRQMRAAPQGEREEPLKSNPDPFGLRRPRLFSGRLEARDRCGRPCRRESPPTHRLEGRVAAGETPGKGGGWAERGVSACGGSGSTAVLNHPTRGGAASIGDQHDRAGGKLPTHDHSPLVVAPREACKCAASTGGTTRSEVLGSWGLGALAGPGTGFARPP